LFLVSFMREVEEHHRTPSPAPRPENRRLLDPQNRPPDQPPLERHRPAIEQRIREQDERWDGFS
jgi:hypothetical protein